MKKLLILLLAMTCMSCGLSRPRANKLNTLSIGMSKSDALDKMGDPVSTRAADGVEYLIYNLKDAHRNNSEYFVEIKGGKVSAFGKDGDFGTNAPEAKKIIIDKHVTNH
jgi:hypothetical protein